MPGPWYELVVGYVLTTLIELPILVVGLGRAHSLGRRVAAGFWLTGLHVSRGDPGPAALARRPFLGFEDALHRRGRDLRARRGNACSSGPPSTA